MLGLIPKPWLYVGAALAAVALVGVVYVKGERAGTAKVEARVERAINTEVARQAAIADAVLDAERAAAAERETEIATLQQQVETYEAEIAQRDDRCLISDDDARRLRNIK